MILTSREQRRQLERDNAKLPATLAKIPRHEWPNPSAPQLEVWRSRDFLVQVFTGSGPCKCRLSINRTTLDKAGRWVEGISWDELQRLKRECGFANFDAVEVYPRDRDVVNVANMRHLWVLHEPLPFAWRDAPSAPALSIPWPESPAEAWRHGLPITDRAEIERTFAADAEAEEAAAR